MKKDSNSNLGEYSLVLVGVYDKEEKVFVEFGDVMKSISKAEEKGYAQALQNVEKIINELTEPRIDENEITWLNGNMIKKRLAELKEVKK